MAVADYQSELEPLYMYIRVVHRNGRAYRYLVVEEYLGQGRRHSILLRLPVEEAAKLLLRLQDMGITSVEVLKEQWCGGGI